MRQLGSRLPRPVLVAEVTDPVKFGRALDAVMVEVNRALKARAAEEAAAAAKAAADADAARGTPAPEPERKGRRRDNEPPAPEFRMVAAGGTDSNKTYLFSVPSTSPTKIFPPGVKPAVRLEGKHVAFSTSSEAARVAIESLQRKSWTPPPDLERSLAGISENTVFLLYGDPRESTPAILASLPGTLQTIVNTTIAAVARAEAATPGAPGGPGVPGGPGSAPYPQGMMGMMRGGPGRPGFPGAPGMGGPGQGPGSTEGSMIQIKVEPDKLPKADDLKALMFPWTFSVAADDAAVQFVTRQSFPDLAVGTGAGAGLAAVLTPAVVSARKAARAAQEAKEAKAAEAAGNQPGNQPGAQQPGRPGFGGPGGQPGFGPAGRPGGGGGRGRRDD
jgi:hypothetical protein